jgi:hypothetical protein
MTNVTHPSISTWEFKKSSSGRKPRLEPNDPEKVLRIIYLRETLNMRWRKIGEEMGMTHQGPYLLYKRWREWAYSLEE